MWNCPKPHDVDLDFHTGYKVEYEALKEWNLDQESDTSGDERAEIVTLPRVGDCFAEIAQKRSARRM